MNVRFTPNEAIARKVVDRLCRRPPYGLSWRDFAILEITRALATAATCRRNKNLESFGIKMGADVPLVVPETNKVESNCGIHA
jgi:hypothetical protein